MDVEKIVESELSRSVQLEAFRQDVWDYAQAHYNVGATRLNGWDRDIDEAFDKGQRDAVEFVDGKFWGY